MKSTTLLGLGLGLASTGTLAQETTFPNTINCRAFPAGDGLTSYEVHIGKPDSTCKTVTDILGRLPNIASWLCAGYITHNAIQVHITAKADYAVNQDIVNAIHEAFPDLPYACKISEGSEGIVKRGVEYAA